MSLPARPPNLFQQILSPKALIVGAVLATVWIYFLGLQTVRLIEAALPHCPNPHPYGGCQADEYHQQGAQVGHRYSPD
jgi:hypothetical protein